MFLTGGGGGCKGWTNHDRPSLGFKYDSIDEEGTTYLTVPYVAIKLAEAGTVTVEWIKCRV